MSFKNLYEKYKNDMNHETIALYNSIVMIVEEMNLKTFRNKFVGHYDLDEKLGKNSIQGNITTDNLEELMANGQRLLNLIIKDAPLLASGHILAYYSPISQSRSVQKFLNSFVSN
jgi:hypothetical protein